MRKGLFFAFLLFFFVDLSAKKNQKTIASLPFQIVGSYMVMSVKVNDSSPLNLILDSGIRNTLITELQEDDRISLNYSDVKDLMGLGNASGLEAFSSNFNTLKIGKITLNNKTVHVLKEDIFNLSKHTGNKINGLIGVDFFQSYVVGINYSKKRIDFYNKDSFIPPQGYEKMPITIEGGKMFIDLTVVEADSTKRSVRMLIDTGAELNAWFQTFTSKSIHSPQKGIKATIGQGLNGEIVGKIARIPQICFGNYCLQAPIVAFPDSLSISEIILNSKRDGTVGSQILNRFNYIIDYENQVFYYQPNSNFNAKFSFNVAGIDIIQMYPFLPQTEVWKVWEESSADKAGVKVGDQILEVNGKKSAILNISEIKAIFQTVSKYPMQLKVLRDDNEISLEIDMNIQI